MARFTVGGSPPIDRASCTADRRRLELTYISIDLSVCTCEEERKTRPTTVRRRLRITRNLNQAKSHFRRRLGRLFHWAVCVWLQITRCCFDPASQIWRSGVVAKRHVAAVALPSATRSRLGAVTAAVALEVCIRSRAGAFQHLSARCGLCDEIRVARSQNREFQYFIFVL